MKTILLVPLRDYYQSRKRIWVKYLIPVVLGLLALAGALIFNIGNEETIRSTFSEFVNVQLNVVAILVSFSVAIISILVTADNANTKSLKEEMADSTQYKPVGGKQLSLFQILLSNIAYNVIVEIIYLVILIGIALLCAAPCPRKSYVIAKYICYLIFYGACVAVYSIIAAIYPRLDFLNILEALTVFLVGAILYGIYTPVAIKYGITKARLVFTVAILLISLGPTLVVQVFHPDMKLILSFMQNTSNMTAPIILGIAGIGVFLLSMIISIRIFVKKEL